jgi:hypothetical protein
MEDCCSTKNAQDQNHELSADSIVQEFHPKSVCPGCGQEGKPVQGQTVKAMLAVSLSNLVGNDYLFCRTASCNVVYFSKDGYQIFSKSQIRERVYQKEPQSGDVFVCYCFRHTVGEISNAAPKTLKEIIIEINAGVQAGQCACDLRNPQGSCCLGNIHKLIRQVQSIS